MGARNYIDAQLNPQRIPLPPELQARLDGLATYQLSATQLYVQYGPPSFPGKDASPEEKMRHGSVPPATSLRKHIWHAYGWRPKVRASCKKS